MYVHVVENTTLFIYVHVPVIQQCTNRIHVYIELYIYTGYTVCILYDIYIIILCMNE